MNASPRIWLFKTEPDEFSVDDLQQKVTAPWDGIRNYKARNYLRDDVLTGDLVYLYHSSCKQIGLAGMAKIARGSYADPAQFDQKSPYFDKKSSLDAPKWFCVDIIFERKFNAIIPLAQLKQITELQGMLLFKQPRLSVSPVSTAEHKAILKLIDK